MELKEEVGDSCWASCQILVVCLPEASPDSMEGEAKCLGSTVVG